MDKNVNPDTRLLRTIALIALIILLTAICVIAVLTLLGPTEGRIFSQIQGDVSRDLTGFKNLSGLQTYGCCM